jgi:hypothetical protein
MAGREHTAWWAGEGLGGALGDGGAAAGMGSAAVDSCTRAVAEAAAAHIRLS